MLTFALFIAAQAAATAPQPGPIKSFGAWVVACDNTRHCEMTSIWPDDSQPDDGSPYGEMSVSIDASRGRRAGGRSRSSCPPMAAMIRCA